MENINRFVTMLVFSIQFVPQIQFHKARAFPGTEAAGKGRTAKTPIVCYHSTFRLEQFSHQTYPGVSCYDAGVCVCVWKDSRFVSPKPIDRSVVSQPARVVLAVADGTPRISVTVTDLPGWRIRSRVSHLIIV